MARGKVTFSQIPYPYFLARDRRTRIWKYNPRSIILLTTRIVEKKKNVFGQARGKPVG